jgi:predicted N-acetyltransferase YhbS
MQIRFPLTPSMTKPKAPTFGSDGSVHSKKIADIPGGFSLEYLLPSAAGTDEERRAVQLQEEGAGRPVRALKDIRQGFENLLKHPRGRLFVVRDTAQTIVACGFIRSLPHDKLDGDVAVLSSLIVAGSAQGKKLASRLVDARIQFARDHNYSYATLYTHHPYVKAMALSRGFEHFLSDIRDDDWYVKKLKNSSPLTPEEKAHVMEVVPKAWLKAK